MRNTSTSRVTFGLMAFALLASTAAAELVRFEIVSREPFAGGQEFGNAGRYERISGRLHYALDPDLPRNQVIVDLSRAPRNQDGRVEFHADLLILAPADLSKGNGALLSDVNNRGNKLALGFFNSGGNGNKADEPGDGFLMRSGFTVVWSGWDGELLPKSDRLHLHAPVAAENGQPITGLVRCEISPNSPAMRAPVVPWDNHGSYRPTARGLQTATLTHRQYPGNPRVEIPRDQWTLHVTEVSANDPSQLPKLEIELPAGLQPGHLYELIYEAQGPIVQGVGFAAVRDLVSALKNGTGQDNPLASPGRTPLKRAHGFGVSQSGRFLREFLYWGFNAPEQGEGIVFDGVIPHVSGSGMGSFNHRFAQPTRHCNQHDHHDYPGDRFPFSYGEQRDPFSGEVDGLLKRSLASGTAPRIMHTQSAAEYWTRSGSLTHTDPQGQRDAAIPDNVRIYLFGGTQHGPASYPPGRGSGENLVNPGDYKPFLRALLLALDRWAKDGTPPPASVYPTLQAGTLVAPTQSATSFPKVPGVRYPNTIQAPPVLDFGPRWANERIIDHQPPHVRGQYTVLVPKCGVDGNELGCLLPPEVAVPVATYTGWNLRHPDSGAENDLVALTGSYIPFATSKAERMKKGDPRLSVDERYGSLATYVEQLQKACRDLESRGLLLPEDTQRILATQEQRVKPLFGGLSR